MHRSPLLNLLDSYQPQAPEEHVYKEQITQFVKHHPQCFDRTLEIGHITASSWLLNKSGTHALLTHHAKLNAWFQLGGHCDGDADVLAVALKEAQEESGIMHIKPIAPAIFDIDIHLIPANSRERAHYHYDIRFLLQVMSDEEFVQSAESKALAWVSQDKTQLPTQERSITRMFDKWVR
ncbi:MAG TPA: NUDIX hydrolase [Candidatus Limnocylindria bacterium]|nr:NUDIX hydrolase [Candidatus Limnocylindria bacterium]